MFCRTSSSTIGKLAFLNNLVGAFEYKVDENGNICITRQMKIIFGLLKVINTIYKVRYLHVNTMHKMHYTKVMTVLTATIVVAFALILIGSLNGSALGTIQGNDKYSLIAIWGTGEGTEDAQFKEPHDVAVDSSDNVYVVDTKNYRVQKFTSDGKFITKWDFEAAGDGNGEPHGIEIDSLDNVYVAIRDNSKILIY